MSSVSVGSYLEPPMVPLAQLLPSRRSPVGPIQLQTCKPIKTSIESVGMIEPLSIVPSPSGSGEEVAVDGHVRLQALRELSVSEASCRVAKDEEGYT